MEGPADRCCIPVFPDWNKTFTGGKKPECKGERYASYGSFHPSAPSAHCGKGAKSEKEKHLPFLKGQVPGRALPFGSPDWEANLKMGSALRIAEGQVKCGALAARIAKVKSGSRYANREGQERLSLRESPSA